MPLLAGDKIESYELVRKCGRGTYGEVWIAMDPLKRKVALKIIDKFSRAKEELNGLMTYFEMPPNPNLISIYHIGETEDFYYYTMELADNASDKPDEYIPLTLEEALNKNGPFSALETYQFGIKLLNGVSALHSIGLVHRDLKPSNIIYVNGIPKISDVGLIIKANIPATLIGSIGFMPPERFTNPGKATYTVSDDLYAIGKILYCYWTGNPPEEYPSLPAKCFASPQDAALNNVIKHTCSNNPENRIRQDDAFAEMLNSILSPGTSPRLGKTKKRISVPAILIAVLLGIAAFCFCLKYKNFVEHQHDYLVIDLSSGAKSDKYPLRWSTTPPDLNSPKCRTTELWLKRIPAGSFMMGSPEKETFRNTNETLHKVDIQNDFYLGIFEITQMQYINVMGYHDSRAAGDTRPVEWIAYNKLRKSPDGWPEDAHKLTGDSFLKRLQDRTGLLFDLPTEAEWEYACRAGTTGPIYLEGSNSLEFDPKVPPLYLTQIAHFYNNCGDFNKTAYREHTTVGSYLPNAWGLYDMQGNVWEWCLDWYEESPTAQPGKTPKGPWCSTIGKRVTRGSDWLSHIPDCRAALRRPVDPNTRHNTGGFRIAYSSDLPDITLP